MASTNTHSWKFVRIGGVDQVVFRNAADIANIANLDQKLWMALAMPTRGVEFDAKTADLIDADKDGRIRPPEVLAAVKWAESAFNDLGDLMRGGDSVQLSAIKDPNILAGAKRILASLNKPNEQVISLADVSDTVKILAETKFNGDGVVIAESSDDAAIKKAIEDIIASLGAVTDRSGKPGLNQAKLDQFFVEAQTLSDWAAKGEADKSLTPLGFDGTAAASGAIKAVKAKVDDFFARCRLAAFDPRALAAVNRSEVEYLAVAAKDMSITAQEVAGFPLAKIEANAALPLSGAVNPAWAGALAALNSAAVTPLLGAGKTSLTEADWAAVQSKVGPFDVWTGGKPATATEKLGLPRLRELIKSGAKDKIAALIKQDAALESEFAQMVSVEKLVRFQKDFYELLTNFVNFADFYGKTGAVFQAGTLYLDNRSCNLCIDVTDPGKHAALAGLAGAYLAYCDCTRPGGQKRTIVAVFSNGDSENLMTNRNGVFYDRKGNDWDATITKIIDNPISIRQAFWSPYKKLIRMIEEQAAKRAAAADAQSTAAMQATADSTVNADKKAPEPKKIDTGTLAAIGLVLTTLLGALGTIFSKILGLAWWQIPLALAAIILAISLPSMAVAWLKLRKRNLGPILDANGWAINNAAKMNIPFGASLTDIPKLPPGTDYSYEDPYAEKQRPWKLYIAIVAVLVLGWCWYVGKLDKNLPPKLKSTSVIGTNAPAWTPPTNSVPSTATPAAQ
ncbi:MAG: hypothetical protein RLY20_3261 [Verrucomicrobiota bacterium]|jgi:hypothetical protein